MKKKVNKNVLIIGNCAKEYSLAKKLSENSSVQNIFVAPGNDGMSEFCTCIDIREDKPLELLEFAMENSVDLTIVASEKSIKADVAGIFQKHGQLVFGPTAESAEIGTNKSVGKKFMYKLRIPSASFGVYDKQNLALDYIRKCRMPIVTKTDEHRGVNGRLVCSTFSIAKSFVEDSFLRGEKRVIIEDFIYGHEFSFYAVTDGYKAIPLTTVANYKFALDGDGGLLTSGMGSYAPDYKISKNVEQHVLDKIIYPTIEVLSEKQIPYIGILGVDCVLTPDNDVVAIDYNTFLQEHDCQSVLSLMNEDIYKLIESCTIGAFADDYEKIEMADDVAVSCVLSSGKKSGAIISGLDKIDESTKVAHFNTHKNKYLEFETTGDRTLLITKNAKTITRAVENLYEEVELIEFDGKKHRKDLCLVQELV